MNILNFENKPTMKIFEKVLIGIPKPIDKDNVAGYNHRMSGQTAYRIGQENGGF